MLPYEHYLSEAYISLPDLSWAGRSQPRRPVRTLPLRTLNADQREVSVLRWSSLSDGQ